jgi:hypothetical protein
VIDFRVMEKEKGQPAVSTKATKGTKKDRKDKGKRAGKERGKRT